jgi:hypothetical protein
MKTFEQILEEVKNINSDKETRIQDYQDKLAYFNSNKTKFMSILTTRPQPQWETEANKIIKGNVYLGKKWTADKLQYSIDQDTLKVNGNEMSADEKKQITLNIAANKLLLNKEKIDLDRQTKEDLQKLNEL